MDHVRSNDVILASTFFAISYTITPFIALSNNLNCFLNVIKKLINIFAKVKDFNI